MCGPENGYFPLLYVVKMSLCRWVGTKHPYVILKLQFVSESHVLMLNQQMMTQLVSILGKFQTSFFEYNHKRSFIFFMV